MDLLTLKQELDALMAQTPLNIVQAELALQPELAGIDYFEPDALLCAADAGDDLFLQFQNPQVVGPHHALPRDWLPEAKTVLCFFFRYTERVRRDNASDLTWPTPLWLHARIEGQQAIRAATERLVQVLRDAGHRAVAPLLDERFHSVGMQPKPGDTTGTPPFSSNWSERHAAYAAGLGTFCLSRGMITEKGVAGRFGSVITDLELTPTPRPYQDPYDYCIRCGACARNCPANAFPADGGIKDHTPCSAFLGKTRAAAQGIRYGCGKCQVKVPCEAGIPAPAKKRLGLM